MAGNSAVRTGRHGTIDHITHDNIESILCLEDTEHRRKPMLYRVVERAARFCGTLTFLWINIAFFASWIALNQFLVKFDPYPFTFLLFVVSIEAIMLSILILISQNMSAEASERRHHLDLQINLLNEREMTAMLRLALHMADKLGIDADAQAEAVALSKKTRPEHVLHQIVRAEDQHRQ
ncbi:MAG: DUF1003 domain-containing protein [Variovorax sp.]|nr:MAG: DUF1003 domain-containing protein [Variovorax sp.]